MKWSIEGKLTSWLYAIFETGCPLPPGWLGKHVRLTLEVVEPEAKK